MLYRPGPLGKAIFNAVVPREGVWGFGDECSVASVAGYPDPQGRPGGGLGGTGVQRDISVDTSRFCMGCPHGTLSCGDGDMGDSLLTISPVSGYVG